MLYVLLYPERLWTEYVVQENFLVMLERMRDLSHLKSQESLNTQAVHECVICRDETSYEAFSRERAQWLLD